MARYIDADKVMEEIARIGGHNLCEWETIGVKALIDRQHTADVAPRAEVAREIFEEIERNVHKLETPYQILHCIPQHYITTLKKKYLEERK